jgi:hypothetical protein
MLVIRHAAACRASQSLRRTLKIKTMPVCPALIALMQGRRSITYYFGPYEGGNYVRQAQFGKLIWLRNDGRNLKIKNHYK